MCPSFFHTTFRFFSRELGKLLIFRAIQTKIERSYEKTKGTLRPRNYLKFPSVKVILPLTKYLPLFMNLFIIIKFAQITSKKSYGFFSETILLKKIYLLISQVFFEISCGKSSVKVLEASIFLLFEQIRKQHPKSEVTG